jgi:hypothetical protein
VSKSRNSREEVLKNAAEYALALRNQIRNRIEINIYNLNNMTQIT